MAEAKAQDADRIVAKPPAGVCFFLCYGPDSGLAAERAARLAALFADPRDPFSLIKLDAAAIASDPNRLADEAYAVAMFGGKRAILVKDAGSRANMADVVAGLFKDPPSETAIILEAGELRSGHKLRSLFERDQKAYAIPCYVDDAAAIARLVDDETSKAGLAISPEAKTYLVNLLGGDRLISRGEIQKLCLYCHGLDRIELSDVEALIGDSAGISMDEIIDATATGDMNGLGEALQRATIEGIDPGFIALSGLRHFQMLDEARSTVDSGVKADDVVNGIRPPVFYKRKPRIVAALNLWSGERLVRATQMLADCVRDSRLNAPLARDLVGDCLLTLARVAQARRR